MKYFKISRLFMNRKVMKGFYVFLLSCSVMQAMFTFIAIPISYATAPPPPDGTYVEGSADYDNCIANNGLKDVNENGEKTCTYNYCVNNTTFLKLKECNVNGIIKFITNILSYIVGSAAIICLVASGIIYASDGGSGERVKMAKKWIINIVIGLVVYGLFSSVVAFLIPGGQ